MFHIGRAFKTGKAWLGVITPWTWAKSLQILQRVCSNWTGTEIVPDKTTGKNKTNHTHYHFKPRLVIKQSIKGCYVQLLLSERLHGCHINFEILENQLKAERRLMAKKNRLVWDSAAGRWVVSGDRVYTDLYPDSSSIQILAKFP